MNHSDTDWLPLTARPTALIVSAQASMRRMTSAILRQQQYAVTEARNVADGDSFLMKASSLSLVIASLQIQVGDDGLSLALRLRRADQHLAILVISQSAPTVDQTRSALARDQAQLAQAKEQEARLRPLMEKDYITRNDYAVAATQVKSLEATVSADRAVLEQAQLQLSYAHIKAPISGRTGSLSVNGGAGGLTANDSTFDSEPSEVRTNAPNQSGMPSTSR